MDHMSYLQLDQDLKTDDDEYDLEKLNEVIKEPPMLAQIYYENVLPSRELIFLQS